MIWEFKRSASSWKELQTCPGWRMTWLRFIKSNSLYELYRKARIVSACCIAVTILISVTVPARCAILSLLAVWYLIISCEVYEGSKLGWMAGMLNTYWVNDIFIEFTPIFQETLGSVPSFEVKLQLRTGNLFSTKTGLSGSWMYKLHLFQQATKAHHESSSLNKTEEL